MIEGITLVQALLAAEARHQAARLALEVAFEEEYVTQHLCFPLLAIFEPYFRRAGARSGRGAAPGRSPRAGGRVRGGEGRV